MDNYEREEFPQEFPQQEPAQNEYQSAPYQQSYHQPYQQPYHGAGAGRKESPFANSPYEMNHHRQPSWEDYDNHGGFVPPQEPPRKVKKPRKPMGNTWKRILCVVLALVVVAGSCGFTAMLINNDWEARIRIMEENFEQRLDALQAQIDAGNSRYPDTIYQDPVIGMTPGAVYQKNVESVVLITAKVRATSMFGQPTTAKSTGSGFVLTADGYVVTNHHVVEKATSVTVTMYDGSDYEAKVIGSDSTNDVALLKIEEDVTLQAVAVGSSDALRVGDQVIAIGNPLGSLTSTLTVGYVSAKERKVNTDGTSINMIQTDAAINSGNSGGPLFNSSGEVVGITTAKFSGASSSGASIEGIGFAIPIDDVMPLVDDLMNYGYINSAYLGVMAKDVDATTASYYGLPLGAYVQEVIKGCAAEKAGVKEKDIIVAVGSYKVEGYNDLTKILRKFKAGETTTITVFRSGQELSLSITLDEKPRTPEEDDKQMPGAGELPQEGSYEDWYNYFAPFFDEGRG